MAGPVRNHVCLLQADGQRQDEAALPVREVPGQKLVLAVFEEFLDWCQKHKAPLTYVWYRDRIQAFARTVERRLGVDELKPIHVERWVDAHPDWSTSHQRGCKVAVQRAFAWAEKMGVIDKSPIRRLDKPQQGKREQILSPAEYTAIQEHFPDEAFRDLLEMAWHTGARPQETVRVEARHCDLANRRVVLPPKEAKGKKRYRIIYLNDAALELVKRPPPSGPKARSSATPKATPGPPGRSTAASAASSRRWGVRTCRARPGRSERVRGDAEAVPARQGEGSREDGKGIAAGSPQENEGEGLGARGVKYALYAFRHTFANRLLTAGVDSLTVSTLLGHVDGTMLSRVYQHLQQNADHLLNAVNGVTTTEDAAV